MLGIYAQPGDNNTLCLVRPYGNFCILNQQVRPYQAYLPK